jgi:hypothetical protein
MLQYHTRCTRHLKLSKLAATYRVDMEILNDNYRIRVSNQCDRTVQVTGANGQYNTAECKKIAQAIIHFEPIMTILVSDDKSNMYRPTLRNWSYNPRLGRSQAPRARAQSTELIKNSCSDEEPTTHPRFNNFRCLIHGSEEWRWNCWEFWQSPTESLTRIELHNLPPITSAHDSIKWAEVIGSFANSAMACPSPSRLQEFPNTDAGLRSFGVRLDHSYGDPHGKTFKQHARNPTFAVAYRDGVLRRRTDAHSRKVFL